MPLVMALITLIVVHERQSQDVPLDDGINLVDGIYLETIEFLPFESLHLLDQFKVLRKGLLLQVAVLEAGIGLHFPECNYRLLQVMEQQPLPVNRARVYRLAALQGQFVFLSHKHIFNETNFGEELFRHTRMLLLDMVSEGLPGHKRVHLVY